MLKYLLFLTGMGRWSGKGQKKTLPNIKMAPKIWHGSGGEESFIFLALFNTTE